MNDTTETITLDGGEQIEIARYMVTLDNGDEVLCRVEPMAMARFIVGLAALPVIEPATMIVP